jgi:hypothetical protein
LEIASTFLGVENASKYPKDQLNKLNSAFHSFLTQCEQALRLNKMLITPDQIEYQQDLELGFDDMKAKFSQYLFLDEIQDQEAAAYQEDGKISNLLSLFLDSKSNHDIHSFFQS